MIWGFCIKMLKYMLFQQIFSNLTLIGWGKPLTNQRLIADYLLFFNNIYMSIWTFLCNACLWNNDYNVDLQFSLQTRRIRSWYCALSYTSWPFILTEIISYTQILHERPIVSEPLRHQAPVPLKIIWSIFESGESFLSYILKRKWSYHP